MTTPSHSKTPHLTDARLRDALGDQGWRIRKTTNGFKLYPPDRRRNAIVYHPSVLNGHGGEHYQAFIGKLRLAGFSVPAVGKASKPSKPRGPMLAEVPIQAAATIDENATSYRLLKVADLTVDAGYQRMLRPEHAKAIARAFNPLAFGSLTVSERKDGSLVVVDGQHRREALRLLGREERTVPCLVATGLTREQEAGLFVSLNTFKALGPFDLFNARLVARDPIALAVKRIVEHHGLTIGRTTGPRRLPGVNTLWKAQVAGQLDRILTILEKAWGFDDQFALAAATQSALLRIVNETRWVALVDDKHLVATLERWSPAELTRKAHARIESSTASRPTRTIALVEIIVEAYNRSLPKHAKLPPLGRVA